MNDTEGQHHVASSWDGGTLPEPQRETAVLQSRLEQGHLEQSQGGQRSLGLWFRWLELVWREPRRVEGGALRNQWGKANPMLIAPSPAATAPAPEETDRGTCPAILKASHVEGIAILLGTDCVGGDGEVNILGIGCVVLKIFQVHSQLVLLLQCQEVQVLQP